MRKIQLTATLPENLTTEDLHDFFGATNSKKIYTVNKHPAYLVLLKSDTGCIYVNVMEMCAGVRADGTMSSPYFESFVRLGGTHEVLGYIPYSEVFGQAPFDFGKACTISYQEAEGLVGDKTLTLEDFQASFNVALLWGGTSSQ